MTFYSSNKNSPSYTDFIRARLGYSILWVLSILVLSTSPLLFFSSSDEGKDFLYPHHVARGIDNVEHQDYSGCAILSETDTEEIDKKIAKIDLGQAYLFCAATSDFLSLPPQTTKPSFLPILLRLFSDVPALQGRPLFLLHHSWKLFPPFFA